MRELLKKRVKNQKGLTLIELLAVIVILAIIAAIAIPAIGNMIENSRYNGVKSDAINVLNAANIYFSDNEDENEVTVKTLKEDGYLENEGKVTAGTVYKVAGGNQLEAGPITFSGTKKVTFDKASIKAINDDKTKGSKVDDENGITITTPSGTTTTTP